MKINSSQPERSQGTDPPPNQPWFSEEIMTLITASETDSPGISHRYGSSRHHEDSRRTVALKVNKLNDLNEKH